MGEEVASAPVSVKGNPGVDSMTTIFSGLSLGPGTYYLVIDPSTVNLAGSMDWDAAGTPTQTFGTGASDVMAFIATTTNAAFPPSNTFASDHVDADFQRHWRFGGYHQPHSGTVDHDFPGLWTRGFGRRPQIRNAALSIINGAAPGRGSRSRSQWSPGRRRTEP